MEGAHLDIFRNCAETLHLEDAIPTAKGNFIQFPKGSYAEAVAISPNGQYLVSGSVDGLIEVWDLDKGCIREELAYQKNVGILRNEKENEWWRVTIVIIIVIRRITTF